MKLEIVDPIEAQKILKLDRPLDKGQLYEVAIVEYRDFLLKNYPNVFKKIKTESFIPKSNKMMTKKKTMGYKSK